MRKAQYHIQSNQVICYWQHDNQWYAADSSDFGRHWTSPRILSPAELDLMFAQTQQLIAC